jgi:hypothetical protein
LDGRPFVFTDGQWVAIPFWRNPACVPPDFNLLNLFDPPPRPFNCPLTVDGFAIWKNGPAIDPGPELAHFRGLGSVPVWFVRWSDLQAAVADLESTEFSAIKSLSVLQSAWRVLIA